MLGGEKTEWPKVPEGVAAIVSLPQGVAAQMAAGQVIDSLAAVVRELVENALDAHATRLTVQVWPGEGRIQVVDNGMGMAPDNLPLAAAPHSTSKIRTQQDLWRVSSLGFRGQALHSLAQVGQLTLCSRPEGAITGWQVTYSAEGYPVETQPIAMAPGTIATLTDLFAPWPTRRLGLPTPARQLRQVQQVIYAIALCHPSITWTARLDDRPWFTLTPGPTAKTLLPQMLSSVAAADLREINQRISWPDVALVAAESLTESPSELQTDALDTPDADRSGNNVPSVTNASLYGVIGLPDRCHRARPDWVKVAVNGRLVALPELEQGLMQAFRYTLPRHRYPLCFVHLSVAPHHIDWNRSPDKSTLYLHQLDDWIAQAQACVETLLRQHPTGEIGGTQRVTHLMKTAEAGGTYTPPPLRQVEPSRLGREAPGALTALAQVHNRYILAEQADGLCLIEQHIAHERVLYERLQDQWPVVPLSTPVVLDPLTEDQIEQLERLGLAVEDFGPQRWAVRSAPAPLADRADLADALLELSRGSDLETALVATACRIALRNGTSLSLPEMQGLLNDWQLTRNPRTCPHGRPICLTLSESSLARFFRRHWVIGKSHGLG